MVASLPQIQVLKPPKRGPMGLRGEEGVYKWGNAPKKGPVGLRGGEGVCKYTCFLCKWGNALKRGPVGLRVGEGVFRWGHPHVGLRGAEGVGRWGNASKRGPVGLCGGEGVRRWGSGRGCTLQTEHSSPMRWYWENREC